MANYPLITIVLLNYNRAEDTIECVKSIISIEYPNYEILIIDNCSTDNSLEILIQKLNDVEIIQTEKNLGYTGGVNFGLRLAQKKQSDYILLLNNDTLVEKSFLSELVFAMEKDHSTAAACGTILSEHNREMIWYAGGKLIKWRGLAIHKGKDKVFNFDDSNYPNYTTFITGCMMLIRTKYLKEIGLEDERFFMYLDDIEFSARIQKRGYKLLYVPKSVIYHKVLDKGKSPFMLYYSVRNRLLLISLILSGLEKVIANTYFFTVITIKMIIWKLKNPVFFKASKFGLQDYFRKNFFKGRGFKFY